MSNLFASYIKERQGIDSIWHEHSFVIYRIVGPECFIVDMFVEKDIRAKGNGRLIINELLEIAKKAGCECITGNIHLGDKGANNTLKASQACGFEVVRAEGNTLLISLKV